MKGTITDIQRFSIHDGPGIRTTVFLKGCNMRCFWCHNPETLGAAPELQFFPSKCIGCGACLETCPREAHQVVDSEHVLLRERCVACGQCAETCYAEALVMAGREATASEVMEQVLRDKPFYDNSGGGVTISGGEPTMQAAFLFSLLESLKQQGIHTAIETCGFFKRDLIRELVDLSDLFLFDIKHMNQQAHKKFTGVSNEEILSNFEKIHSSAGSERIIPRIPLIPGFNTDSDAIDEIITFLKQIRYNGPVHLMPYNKMAKTKYEKVGKSHLYQDMGELPDEKIDAIMKKIEDNSFQVVCNR